MDLQTTYLACRRMTEAICHRLEIEDYVVQSMADVSPPKWHLAHTTWFFETFIVLALNKAYQANPLYQYLFNSYYQTVSKPYQRDRRGALSRPTVKEIYAYRQRIDDEMISILSFDNLSDEWQFKITLGINHEQQHQELLLMDIKHNLFMHPHYPAYQKETTSNVTASIKHESFMLFDGGITSVGAFGDDFCYDNELPRHHLLLHPFQIANRLVTNQEYLAFIADHGYARSALWLDDGWQWRLANNQQAPLYWVKQDNEWFHFTLSGLQPLALNKTVAHVTFYEADAFARWRDARLPTEYEWEHAAQEKQLTGDLWVWTGSAYLPYPGYQPLAGTLGEYNGKFMNNQMVLRGGSFATPRAHFRISYRNFFQPNKAWQFAGIRLAKDLKE